MIKRSFRLYNEGGWKAVFSGAKRLYRNKKRNILSFIFQHSNSPQESLYNYITIRRRLQPNSDWILTNTSVPIWKLYTTGNLRISEAEITLSVNSYEDLLRCGGHGEKEVLEDFMTSIQPEDTIWDIGANVGSYSLLAATQSSSVIAFEPGAEARQSLKRNAEINELSANIRVVEKALSSWNGEGVLISGERPGVQKISHEGDGEPIEVYRGDDLNLPEPDVIKIDVEGEEVEVLLGMEKRLENCRLCYVELHTRADSEHVVDKLKEAGLVITDKFGNDPILRAERLS